MIKRPGNEGYLNKVVEEERKPYLKVLEVSKYNNTSRNIINNLNADIDQNDGGLIMMSNS